MNRESRSAVSAKRYSAAGTVDPGPAARVLPRAGGGLLGLRLPHPHDRGPGHRLSQQAGRAHRRGCSGGSGGQVAGVEFVRDALSKDETFKVQLNDPGAVPTAPADRQDGAGGRTAGVAGRRLRVRLRSRRGRRAGWRRARWTTPAAGGRPRRSAGESRREAMQEPGGRYIDFLVPGLLGMSLMGGGLWGVGFVTVDMRIRKVLKRFLATPMRKSDFLVGILISRLLFLVPEVLVLLLFARLAFGVVIQGSLLAVVVLILLGALTFAGIGLLVASRARTLEAVSGLMNLVMLPMWVLSGIFFSSERFPEAMQPFIKALPLTPLIDALRSGHPGRHVLTGSLAAIGHPVWMGVWQFRVGPALVPLELKRNRVGACSSSRRVGRRRRPTLRARWRRGCTFLLARGGSGVPSWNRQRRLASTTPATVRVAERSMNTTSLSLLDRLKQAGPDSVEWRKLQDIYSAAHSRLAGVASPTSATRPRI